jgi:hypothetical protein
MTQIRTIPYSGSVPTTNQLPLGDIAINTYDGKAYIKQASGSSQSIVQIGAGGGVTQIVAGTNVTLSPTTGVGVVTVNAIAGGGGSGSPNGPLYSLQYNNGGLFSGSGNFTLLNNNELYLTGSLKVSGSITGSLFGTSSWSNNSTSSSFAQSASLAQSASTASYVLNAISSSFSTTSSYSLYAVNALSSSFALTASYWSGSILNATSASYALSSSYSGTSTTSSYAQTASHATTAVTASYALNGGVTQLLAGPNITLSPTTGVGQVTISSTGGSGGSGNTATGSYGSFYSTQTQTNVASTARSMSLNVTDITNGVSISGSTSPFNTYIKVQNPGVYDIQFSAQVDKTDSGTDEIWIWIRKNGSDISDSATSVQLTGNGAHYVAAWNFFVNAAANDYFQLMWYSPDANIRLHAESAFGVVPGIPSLIVTANRVDQFLSNTGSFSGSFIGSLTGSLLGTASFAITANTASYVLNAISSSFALTASYWSGSIANTLSSSFATTASYWSGSILNATSASFAPTASYVLNAVSSSFASTSSYINTLNQNAIISGSLTVGNRTDTPASENTLNVYPPLVGGTGEGGQILLAASGGLYSSASMLDNWQDQFRILRGSNTGGSNAGLVYVNLQTGNTQFVGAVTASAYSGLPNAYLYANRTTTQSIASGTWANRDVVFSNLIYASGISYDAGSGTATLTGGKVYRITARVAWASLGSYTFEISCYDNLNTQLGPIAQQLAPGNGSLNSSDGTLDFIYAPVSSTSIKIRTTGATSALSGEYIRGDLNTQLIIQQIA